MTDKYAHTITKEEIDAFPLEHYTGRIIVLTNEKEANRAVEYLQKFPVIGFDTETRPSFRKGKRYKVSLVQLSTEDTCFLFRLNRMGFPSSLLQLLGNEKVMKIGLSVRDDFNSMRKRVNIEPQNFLELQSFVAQFGIEEASLQKIYAILFGQKISKNQQLSNWEAPVLTEAQQIYAATDAWACLNIYSRLNELKETGDFEIEALNLKEAIS